MNQGLDALAGRARGVWRALHAAEAAALPLPFASALRDRFLVAMATGLVDKDWAAVARTLPHEAIAP